MAGGILKNIQSNKSKVKYLFTDLSINVVLQYISSTNIFREIISHVVHGLAVGIRMSSKLLKSQQHF